MIRCEGSVKINGKRLQCARIEHEFGNCSFIDNGVRLSIDDLLKVDIIIPLTKI